MGPSAEQQGRLHYLLLSLLLLLQPFVCTLAVAVTLPSEGHAVAQNALVSLVSGPLHGHDLLLVSDDHSQNLLDLEVVMAAAGGGSQTPGDSHTPGESLTPEGGSHTPVGSYTPVSLATQESLLFHPRPVHHTKGSLLTAIIIFYSDPTEFFVLLEDNIKWNPNYLILFCLDAYLDTTTVIGLPVVQRSEFILLLQPEAKVGSKRLTAFTSLPTRPRAPLGFWSLGMLQTRQTLFPPRFQDFGGQVLKVPAVCYDEPFMYVGDDGDCTGVSSDALHVIGKKHNFTHKSYQLEVVVWSLKENGTWKGMLGEILYEGKHIVLNSMKLNPEECKDFDFTYPYWRHNFAIILRIPPAMPRWRNILYPFSRLTWAVVLGTTVLVASLLALLVHCVHNLSDPLDIALKVVSGLFGQAMNYRRVRMYPWARVWLIFWWISVDILSLAYVSNLMSVLTVPVYPERLQTLQDLAQSKFIPSMVEYGIFVPHALKVSKNPTYAILGKKMFLDTVIYLPDPYDFLLKKVMNGTHALIESIDYLVFTQHRKGLSYSAYIMDEKLYNYYMSWFLPPNTPYTSLFSDRLQRLLETGILAQIYEKHLATITARGTRGRGSGVLSLDHLQGAFIALGLGAVTATLVLFVERIVHSKD